MRSSLETRVGMFILLALAIFMYMGFQIGSFRFDKASYRSYPVFFKDISGLSRKAEVKIAGVKVGWVDNITLVPGPETTVEAQLMILKDYQLYHDSYAIVRQDGLLGPKYLEVVPGDPLLEPLAEGEALKRPSKAPVAVDDIMRQVKNIAANMEEITDSFKQTVGGVEGKENLHNIMDNLARAANRIASVTEIVDRAIGRNEENIDNFFAVGSDVRNGVDRVTGAVERDFDRIASSLENTAESFDEAAAQAREGLRNFNSIVGKIDEGKGLLGKLVNEEETYRDLKIAIEGLKDYFAIIERLQIVFDSHFETMQRPGEHYKYEDAKGYFEVRIHPNDDHFYLLQMVTSEKGFISRRERHNDYYDYNGRYIDPDLLTLTDYDKLRLVYDKRRVDIFRGAIRFGVQFGKVFDNVAFRFGIFDGTAGGAVDFDIPFKTDKLRWVTSFEAFDLTGWNRIHDRTAHLKWINRVFMFRNIYATFGADDFISKKNANAFFGFGLRFGDDDIKWILSTVAGAGRVALTS